MTIIFLITESKLEYILNNPQDKSAKGGFEPAKAEIEVTSVSFWLIIFLIAEGFIFLQSKIQKYVPEIYNTGQRVERRAAHF